MTQVRENKNTRTHVTGNFEAQQVRTPLPLLKQNAQLPLREQGVSCMLSSYYNGLLMRLKLPVRFLANLHDNGRICESTK